jgi:formylglycine-generating enzyme required for sulfatase activity
LADIFISYKKEDYARAERVASALRIEGFSVWWDEALTPREAWDALIEREIAAAASVVVLWSPRSVTSEWVRTEAHYGQERFKLVPVMIEACELPLAFRLRQTINLCSWHDDDRVDRQWRKLLTWIADLVGTKPGNANIPAGLSAAQPNRFRDAVGRLASGDPIYDGALINASTPVGTVFRDKEQAPIMRIVPKGAFLLGGSPNDPDRTPFEGPQRRVEVPAPFAIGVYPVIEREYGSFPGVHTEKLKPRPEAHGWLDQLLGRSKPEPAAPVVKESMDWWLSEPETVPGSLENPDRPVTNVSFTDATNYVRRLSAETGEIYRLPSEAEWEYACRANSRTCFSWGDKIDRSRAAYAWDNPGALRLTGPVQPGGFPPNDFGLYDMHGNVSEWTLDLWHENYDMTPLDGSPAIEGHGSMRVVRGGSWADGPALLRSSARMRATETSRVAAIGFRVVRALG